MKYRSKQLILQLAAALTLILFGMSIPIVFLRSGGASSPQVALEPVAASQPAAPAVIPTDQGKVAVEEKKVDSALEVRKDSPPEVGSVRSQMPEPRKKNLGNFNFDKTVKRVLLEELRTATDDDAKKMTDFINDNKVTFIHGDLGESCYQVCRKQKLNCGSTWYIRMNKCKILREIFPESEHCNDMFYGRDLPAFRPSDKNVLVNSKPSAFYPSCGIGHELTERPCGCEVGYKEEVVTYHTVFNCQPSKYFEWQARYSYFWFKQVQQPGKWTRLLSAGGPDHLMDELPTHVAPAWDMSVDAYTPYNKPQALAHWLANVDVKEDVIILLDPDCMFIEKSEIPVKEGFPVGMAGYYNFPDDDPESVETEICRRYCPHCKWFDPIAVPVIIHKNDAKKLAPLWLETTIRIRKDRDNWPARFIDNSKTVNSLSWVAEMYGYVVAAAMLGLRHEVFELQGVPGVHKKTMAPFLHYHISVDIDNFRWNKGNTDAATNFPWPINKDMKDWDPIRERFFKGMHDALEAVGKSTYQWPPNLGWRDPES